ncbi:restriction endonuclease subunit S [Vibrio metschnikovii]|nr:restriction endonuclease subunit S [Vibrio metschnikovii]
MNDIEQELENMTAQLSDQPEIPLPSLEEQRALVVEFKRLEAAGELTPEILEQHFGQFFATSDAPVH